MIKLLPPLTISNEDLLLGLEILEQSIESVVTERQSIKSISVPSLPWQTASPSPSLLVRELNKHDEFYFGRAK